MVPLEVALTPSTLLIFPEVLALTALRYSQSPRGVWWLSVDNAFASWPDLTDAQMRSSLFQVEELVHFHQSCYAQDFLLRNGARQVVPLSDFVERTYRLDWVAAAAKATWLGPRTIAIFPRKGGLMASSFIERNPDLPVARIENMSREQVGHALAGTSVYIDFGHHPGKDRVPREAAFAGNIIFLHEHGAGRFHADYPLDSFYLFTPRDVISGELSRRVREALNDYPRHLERQTLLRQRVTLEYDHFMLQVQEAFFAPAG